MSENRQSRITCPKCGAELPVEATAGLCPRCLMAEVMGHTPSDTVPVPDHATPAPDDLAPLFPQLEILECLGRGGMGVVFKARQKSLNRLVALKLLAPDRASDALFAKRFAKEAQALAALNHPNIVTIHDFGQTGGYCYLLMEYVDGATLRQAMRAAKFTPAQALAIVPQICDALQYAHEHDVVHRDIKPENLLLDKKGRVKIADFGIAKMLNADAGGTSATETIAGGTPRYTAPEQWEGRGTDHRTDIYSLGVVFYEMLTGELPSRPIAPPSKKVVVDVRLDTVVLRTLEENPDRRYQTIAEVKTMVEAAASPVPKMRVKRFLAGAGIALLAILGLVVAWTALALIKQNDSERTHEMKASTLSTLTASLLTMIGFAEPPNSTSQQAAAQQRAIADKRVYSENQLREIESLYQVANKRGNTPEAMDSLKKLVEKYTKANRTGCAVLYLGQMSVGEKKETYLKQAIRDFGDCYYGDGVQVGAFARFCLANYYREQGKEESAIALFDEIRNNYPNAITHQGKSLKEEIQRLTRDRQPPDWQTLLTPEQKQYVAWDERSGVSDYDPKRYEVGDKRNEFEAKWLALLEGQEPGNPGRNRPHPYDDAMYGLATIKSAKAAPLLMKIAAERVVKSNVHRHYATKALGILGDKSAIPALIPLLYHYNLNTRWNAQISLVQLTGENFGRDAEAWGDWYNANRQRLGANLPAFDPTPVDWSCGSTDQQLKAWCDPKTQIEDDEKRFGGSSGTEQPPANKGFAEREKQDAKRFSQTELQEINRLYGLQARNVNKSERLAYLKTLVEKFSGSNRAGCAMLYLGFYAPQEERERYFKEAINRYGDCFYGDGVQVGAFARFGLAEHYRTTGKNAEASALLKEIASDYPDAVNHQGKPLLAEQPTAARETVTLTKPYPVTDKDAPTGKIAVQYAAIELCKQAGLQYNWEASFKNTDPVCRKWVSPEIRNKTFRDAMKALLDPVGLKYELREKEIVLKKP